MKKYLIAISGFFLPLTALAHSAHHEENPSIAYQLGKFLSFGYLESGDWLMTILSIILWASLIYVAYLLVKKVG